MFQPGDKIAERPWGWLWAHGWSGDKKLIRVQDENPLEVSQGSETMDRMPIDLGLNEDHVRGGARKFSGI
jgi:hypothetical protein